MNKDDGDYLSSRRLRNDDWKANEKAKHDRVERLIQEEKVGRAHQIKYKNDRQGASKSADRARENRELRERRSDRG